MSDGRLSTRLVNIASAKAEKPGRAFSGVAGGDWAAAKGYYRLIDQAEESAVSMANILAPHRPRDRDLRQRTMRRMRGQETGLCIQDGTDLDFTGLAGCEGLGVIPTLQSV